MNNKLKTVDAETLLSTPMSKTMFIVDGLISQGVNVISGASKIGKSWLMLWLGHKGFPKSRKTFWGEETQQSECVLPSAAKRRMRSLRRRNEQTVCTPEVQTEPLPLMPAASERAVRFYSRKGRTAKTLVRVRPKTPTTNF